MITPLIRKLSEDGYHVTVNAQAYSASVLKENPYVDNLLVQEREAIPNHWLGEYWEYWKQRYDKYINLSESIEGGLLKVENRRDFYTTKDFRHSTNNVNYHDRTMELGGYPEETGTRGELYFTKSEEKKVRKFIDSARAAGKKFIVMCPLRGSSYHKKYPLLGAVMNQWLKDKPDALVILTGGSESTPLVFDHPQVLSFVNSTWSIRELMLMTKYVDVVLGPETGMLNAAACWDTAKIVYLSHSTEENLTKYWTNTTVLEPDVSRAPCYPCHQLHYSLDSCPLAQLTDKDNRVIDTLPVCAAGAVGPDKVTEALNKNYGIRQSTKAA
jgi:ADP-heptose:LPS heptosyltransferase